VRAPEVIETARLRLRRPRIEDAEAIFARYASDPEVTRYLSWPRHLSPDDTRAFLRFADEEWGRWPAGAYLVEAREHGTLLGGTGLAFEDPETAATGYVLARDAWGQGHATEALRAMVALARSLPVRRLYALCHPGHAASLRVLEKCGFVREASPVPSLFPNLSPAATADALSYVLAGG
jgi:RimJ/RimL family protein N-acetyltransferase